MSSLWSKPLKLVKDLQLKISSIRSKNDQDTNKKSNKDLKLASFLVAIGFFIGMTVITNIMPRIETYRNYLFSIIVFDSPYALVPRKLVDSLKPSYIPILEYVYLGTASSFAYFFSYGFHSNYYLLRIFASEKKLLRYQIKTRKTSHDKLTINDLIWELIENIFLTGLVAGLILSCSYNIANATLIRKIRHLLLVVLLSSLLLKNESDYKILIILGGLELVR